MAIETLKPTSQSEVYIGSVIDGAYLKRAPGGYEGRSNHDSPNNDLWVQVAYAGNPIAYQRIFDKKEKKVVLRQFSANHASELIGKQVAMVLNEKKRVVNVYPYSTEIKDKLEKLIDKKNWTIEI